MAILRPTLQGRKGYNPPGTPKGMPGVGAPFGRSVHYNGDHHGQDYFWCAPSTEKSLGLEEGESLNVYPVKDGYVYPTHTDGLGTGAYQQIDSKLRAYYWHLSRRIYDKKRKMTTKDRIGIMGHTGSSAGSQTHLHFEIRKAPYREEDRIDPEPFFDSLAANQRKVGANGARKRELPNTGSRTLSVYKPGEVKTFAGYVKGDSKGLAPDGRTKISTVDGSSVWFVTVDRAFTHISGYTSKTVKGLTDITSKMFPAPPVVAPAPPVVTPPPATPTEPNTPETPQEPAEPPISPPEAPDTPEAPKPPTEAPVPSQPHFPSGGIWGIIIGALALLGSLAWGLFR